MPQGDSWKDTTISCPFVVEGTSAYQDGSYGLELKPIITETDRPNLWPRAMQEEPGRFILRHTNADIAGAFTPGVVFDMELKPNFELTQQQFKRVDTKEALGIK